MHGYREGSRKEEGWVNIHHKPLWLLVLGVQSNRQSILPWIGPNRRKETARKPAVLAFLLVYTRYAEWESLIHLVDVDHNVGRGIQDPKLCLPSPFSFNFGESRNGRLEAVWPILLKIWFYLTGSHAVTVLIYFRDSLSACSTED